MCELLEHRIGIQRLIAARAKHRREQRRSQFANHDIAIGHRQRAAATIRSRAGIGARALGANAKLAAVKRADRSATRGDGMNPHDRCAQPHAGDLGFKRALIFTGEMRHVGGRAAHVESDHFVKAGKPRDRRSADHAARRAGENRILTLKFIRVRQPTRALHELQAYSAERGLYLLDVAPQNRGQISIDHGGIAARHKLHQR